MVKLRLTRRGLLAVARSAACFALLRPSIARAITVPINDFKTTMTTMFWVGGVDHPRHRDKDWPAGFTPKENPFYVALPYGEFGKGDRLKTEACDIPWYRPGLDPLLKNRWVEIRYNGRSCYAQWQDVGPSGEDDFAFVFGDADVPLNTFDAEAGLDVSPAVWHRLGMTDNALTEWRFVEESEVPDGPWTEIVTISGNNRW
jgi:hypothetical protein